MRPDQQEFLDAFTTHFKIVDEGQLAFVRIAVENATEAQTEDMLAKLIHIRETLPYMLERYRQETDMLRDLGFEEALDSLRRDRTTTARILGDTLTNSA